MANPEAVGAAIITIKESIPERVPFGWGTEDTLAVWEKAFANVADESLASAARLVTCDILRLEVGKLAQWCKNYDWHHQKTRQPETPSIETKKALSDEEIRATLDRIDPGQRDLLLALQPKESTYIHGEEL